MPGVSGYRSVPALILRSLALFGILWQFRLLGKELADTPVFAAALIAAFAAAAILYKRKIPPVSALIVLIILPWAIRAFIALPRFFFSGPALTLDSLLLNLDRNNFVSLIPFYWAALTTYGALGSRRFLRGGIIADCTLLAFVFSIARTADMEAYRWPVLMIALFGGILFLQMLALVFSLPPEYRLRKAEGIQAGLVLFILVCAGGLLFLRPFQEGALNRGGGLLEPKLLRFDFSQFLRLENEISMNDDLVFIVKKDAGDSHILLRRFVLSGYSKAQGFFRSEETDERAHPQSLPEGKTMLETEPIRESRLTNQEYYLVNFDASALIAMKQPVLITPFDTWDASSFNSAYAVQSLVSEAGPFELMDSVRMSGPVPRPAELGLSPGEYAFYTEYGGDGKIAAFAQEITRGLESYWEKVYAVYERLKYGEYRYSLKPGIAPDGDQLSFFLFDAKKGYCSYYAFSMAMLLRSLGIPARVGVGFFIDPELNTFDYYPVRANMAHAWVEVWYPEYGWIEYDPTSNVPAAGEEFRPPSNIQDTFERLLKEILENHSRLTPREKAEDERAASAIVSAGRRAVRFITERWAALLAAALGAAFIAMRLFPLAASKLSRNPRKKAVRLWNHAARRLALGGWRRNPAVTEAEWAAALDSSAAGVYSLYQAAAAARYARSYGREDFRLMEEGYSLFSAAYRGIVPLRRRVLAWILPPLALALGPGRVRKKPGGGILLLLLFLLLPAGDRTGAQEDEAGRLFREGSESQNAENWERAIELYQEGAERFPLDIRFPWTLGDLYFSRGLYRLAQDEYRKVDRILPPDPGLLYRLFQTSGYLNENETSAEYLERLLFVEPGNTEAVNNLGWMYYKLHRLSEAEQLFLAIIEDQGTDAALSMTLGTVYADMFRYGDAKRWYLDAIAQGEALGNPEFTAVAHYNLAILESRFYRFSDSFDRTNLSLAARGRSSGRLMRGELFLRRLDILRAVAEYQEAYETDTSTLSKMNLAEAYRIAGRLEEARLYAGDSLNAGDLSWMLNYGIDPVQYKRDLHEILYDAYAGLVKQQSFTVYGSLGDWIRGGFRLAAYRFKAAVHRRLFEKYSLISAAAYGADTLAAGEVHLKALTQYYDAFKTYPRRALTYLRAAREFELPLIPQSEPSYDAEEGALLKNRELLRNALERFDPVWERDMIADVYAELARRGGNKNERREAAERLYALNRGALLQQGISLPAELVIPGSGGFPRPRTERALRRTLDHMGIAVLGADGAADTPAGTGGARFRLSITIAGGSAACELYDSGRGARVFQRAIPLPSLSRKDLAAFARTLGEAVFTAD